MEHEPEKLDYYQRLGVSDEATTEEIEQAYKALRKQFHPDAKPAAYRDYFDQAMKGINEARDVLRDPTKRRRYDARLRSLRSQNRKEHPSERPSRGDKKAPDARPGRSRQSRGRARADEEERRKETRRERAEREARTEEFYQRLEARMEVREREDRLAAEKRASGRLSDKELYVSLLGTYQRLLSAYEDLLDLVRTYLAQNAASRRQYGESLAAEAKRTMEQGELDMRGRCKRGPGRFHDQVQKVFNLRDVLESRTVGLPTERRAELRAVQERIEREAAALASLEAEGSR